MRSDSRLACGTGRWTGLVLLGALLALLSVHAAGVFLDFMASIRYPFQWDYGEGIVWQQAALIPGPFMYSNSQSLPFIVFQFLHNVIGTTSTASPRSMRIGCSGPSGAASCSWR